MRDESHVVALPSLLTFRVQGAQSAFFEVSDYRESVRELSKFLLIAHLECQFSVSANNRFLSPLYLRKQLLRIKFEKCLNKGLPPFWIFQVLVHNCPVNN